MTIDWQLRESGPTDAERTVLLLPGGMCSAGSYAELMAVPALARVRLERVSQLRAVSRATIWIMVREGQISDEFWTVVGPLLPVLRAKAGRPWADHRRMLEGICWRYRTGSPWRDLPVEFGPWQTVWKRHFRWSSEGTYRQILAAVQDCGLLGDGAPVDVEYLLSVDSTVVRAHQHAAGARKDSVTEGVRARPDGHTGGQLNYKNLPVEPADHALGRSRGGLTDQATSPVEVLLTGGQAGDNPQLLPLLDSYRETGSADKVRLLADKAYSHPSTRAALRRRKIAHTIPEKSDQIARRKAKGSRGGRPPAFDAETYKKRNTVERGYLRLKQWRGIATRYDKHARTFLGGVLLATSILHVKTH